MSRAEQEKDQLVKWLLHEGVQYTGRPHTYTHGHHTFYSGGEVRLAKIIDTFGVEYETHVPYENLRDGERCFNFVPDIITKEPIKIVGCSYNITVHEYFGGNFLTHDDIRKMQALRSATGKRGHMYLPGHLAGLEQEGAQWYDKDFDQFRAPGRAENLDEVSLLIMMDVLRSAGIEFFTNPEFQGCIAPMSGRKFTARGHIFIPKPIKIIGIDEPIQYIRCVKRLTKAEIISLEALHATHNINGYALLRQFSLMFKRQGLFKKRPRVPDKFSQHYVPQNGESHKYKDQPLMRPPNGEKY